MPDSSAKLNCWEYMKCGYVPGGPNSAHGICPAMQAEKVNGVNAGRNGGRCCWAVRGTTCHGATQGAFAEKAMLCSLCEFYRAVQREEGKCLEPTLLVLRKLGETKPGCPQERV